MHLKTIKKCENHIKIIYTILFLYGIYNLFQFIRWYNIKKANTLWVVLSIVVYTLLFLYCYLSYLYVEWGNIKIKSEKMVVWYVPKGFLKIKYEDINFIDVEPINDVTDYKIYGYSKKEQKIVYISTNKGNYKIYCKTPKKLINAIYSENNQGTADLGKK